MSKRRWRIDAVAHRETGLIVAFSDDLPGLYVHGRSEEELRERIPEAIRALLEAQGESVSGIVRCDDDELPSSFKPMAAVYALERCTADAA